MRLFSPGGLSQLEKLIVVKSRLWGNCIYDRWVGGWWEEGRFGEISLSDRWKRWWGEPKLRETRPKGEKGRNGKIDSGEQQGIKARGKFKVKQLIGSFI